MNRSSLRSSGKRPIARSDIRKSQSRRKSSLRRSGKARQSFGAVRRNEHGGILVTQKDVRTLFESISENGEEITIDQVHSYMNSLGFNVTHRDVKFYMSNRTTITEEELYGLLRDNQLADFDPVLEAFKSLDTAEKGYVHIDSLKEILREMGAEYVTDEDMVAIMRDIDRDGDGKINLEDFRSI